MSTRLDPLGDDDDEVESGIRNVHGSMMLLISAALWELLVHQAKSEDRKPGDVLNEAVGDYIQKNGTPEAREYVRLVREAIEEAQR